VTLDLTPATLGALATAEAHLALWHHTPRASAVAHALSNGQRAAAAATATVHLGGAGCALAPLLTRPQGVAGCWLVLKSKRGQPVGAVQVAAHFAHIDGRPWDARALGPSPLDSHPEWLPYLPDPLAALALAAAAPAASLATAPLPLLDGQLARCSIYIDQVVLPSGDDLSLDASRGSCFSASYHLPGSCSRQSTSPVAPAQLTPELGRMTRGWGVPLRHCGVHWVVANADLARALLRERLSVAVVRQQAVVAGGGGRGRTAQGEVVEVPVGSAEVDLSGLLLTRPGKDLAARWVVS